MKGRFLIGCLVGCLVGIGLSPVLAEHTLSELVLGDGTFPTLRIWNFVDRVVNARLFVSTTAGPDEDTPTLLYTRVPEGVSGVRSAFSSNIRTEGDAQGVGGFLYAETVGEGIAFGGNAHATTYSGAPAIGLEVNGLNFSGDSQANVRGIDIVNAGNASTQWALGIETSFAAPQGKPKVGIMLAGPSQGFPHNPASHTGIVVGEIDSAEAIRIQEDNRIALSSDGHISLTYNSETNQIEFYNGTVLKHAFAMD